MSIPAFKVKKNGLGSVILTNISGFGEDNIYAPLVPGSRALLTCVFCAPKQRVVVGKSGELEIRKMVNINCTWDCRYFEASDFGVIEEGVRRVWENPQDFK